MDNEQKRVLLVEDEEHLRRTIKLNLELEGYHVTTASTGIEALEKLNDRRSDVVIMDVMLPGMDGFTIVERIRLAGDVTPVLFLTARNAPADRIRGLKAGDDHLGKPFELEELLLRVAKLLRGGTEPVQSAPVRQFSFGENTVDLETYEARGVGGKRIPLSHREVLLLRLLVERSGQVVSREEILQKVWGYDVYPTTRTVDNFIVSFRKYFESEPRDPQHFINIRGVGYKFVP
ncbi:MAG: response regulator transcription factor [Flavobacteriales bacterium]|nr:response regulator transcription factor [Flavobacteriales bacterium]